MFASDPGGNIVFPGIDPIPLPAPVWLFKLLHDLTLALHFVAVQLLLGGLLVAMYLNWRGHRGKRPELVESSGALAGWLPVIMTYVINLGVPPLLFAQVLYGRALYTSSVLIGLYWILVIPLLIFSYHLLYSMKSRQEAGQPWYGRAFLSLLGIWAIGKIYTVNMTLMLEPELWREIYRTHPEGTTMPLAKLQWLPRFLYMLMAGFTAAGAMMVWLGRSIRFSDGARTVMRSSGIKLALLGTVASVAAGMWVWIGQPDAVRDGFLGSLVWTGFAVAWFAAAVGIVVVAGSMLIGEKETSWKPAAALSLVAFAYTAGAVVCRDGIRDVTLSLAGMDVWARDVAVNWSVLGLFLLLFVIGLGIVGWLVSVVIRSKPVLAKGETA